MEPTTHNFLDNKIQDNENFVVRVILTLGVWCLKFKQEISS